MTMMIMVLSLIFKVKATSGSLTACGRWSCLWLALFLFVALSGFGAVLGQVDSNSTTNATVQPPSLHDLLSSVVVMSHPVELRNSSTQENPLGNNSSQANVPRQESSLVESTPNPLDNSTTISTNQTEPALVVSTQVPLNYSLAPSTEGLHNTTSLPDETKVQSLTPATAKYEMNGQNETTFDSSKRDSTESTTQSTVTSTVISSSTLHDEEMLRNAPHSNAFANTTSYSSDLANGTSTEAPSQIQMPTTTVKDLKNATDAPPSTTTAQTELKKSISWEDITRTHAVSPVLPQSELSNKAAKVQLPNQTHHIALPTHRVYNPLSPPPILIRSNNSQPQNETPIAPDVDNDQTTTQPHPVKPYDLGSNPNAAQGTFRQNYSAQLSSGGIVAKNVPKISLARSTPTAEPRRFQLVQIKPSVHLFDSPHNPQVKVLKIDNLFGANVQLELFRLNEAQWRADFLQMSHFMITNTDKLGFFKVSLEQVFHQNGPRPYHHHGLPANVNYHQLMSNHTELYYNERNSTVLLITRLADYIEIYGLINDQLMITPIWRHATAVLKDGWHLPNGFNKIEELNQFYTDSNSRSLLHALIDNRDSVAKHMGFDVSMVLQQIKVHLNLNRRRGVLVPPTVPGLPEPDTMYPEVSLLIDYWAYQAHGRNIGELWRYLVIYFTRLDMVYRQLSKPNIKMRLTNIFVATQPFRFQLAQPKLRFNPAKQGQQAHRHHHRPYLNALKAINELGVYFHLESPTFAKSDLMLVITGEDLCLDQSDSAWASAGSPYDSCSYTTTKGQSFVGGACRTDATGTKNLNVAIVEDMGYFDGILVAAHELGHLMGSVHDGQWPLAGILGPGGRGCTSQRGYLMSTGARTFVPSYNQFKWSNCSAEQFEYFAHQPQAMCLYNLPSF